MGGEGEGAEDGRLAEEEIQAGSPPVFAGHVDSSVAAASRDLVQLQQRVLQEELEAAKAVFDASFLEWGKGFRVGLV